MSDTQEMHIRVERWEAWAPGVRGEQAWKSLLAAEVELDFSSNPEYLWLKPRQRRRLSMITKIVLDVAGVCSGNSVSVPTVFASRRGEVSRMLKILKAVALGEGMSPTDFTMSVHNASSGLFSIIIGNEMPSTAVSAGCDTVFSGFTEAYAQLLNGRRQVLLVVFEDEIPDSYHVFSGLLDYPVAMAFMLSLEVGQLLTIKSSFIKGSYRTADSSFSQLSAVLKTILVGTPSCFTGERRLCQLQLM